MNFDKTLDRRGTNCAKWDTMEKLYGVSNETGISMWIADMDFNPPPCIQNALKTYIDHGIYGYYGDEKNYRNAICWWHENRHGWSIDPSWIFSTHGLVNGMALCIDSFTKPGDAIVLFTPVYHSFFKIINASDRKILECPLKRINDRYIMDFELYDNMMTGKEKLIVLCSPHNPGGRVWNKFELQSLAEFAKRHDLIIVSDEIHQDIVFPGNKHIPLALIDSTINEKLVIMSATTKTFNIAGSHNGNVIIPDPKLRYIFQKRIHALGISPNSFGIIMSQAGYCPEGAEWVDKLMTYIEGNRLLFDDAIKKFKGVSTMALEATYMSWVHFKGTGLARKEILERIHKKANIAANHGETFGKGGEHHLRFNLATQRTNVLEAIDRLAKVFHDFL